MSPWTDDNPYSDLPHGFEFHLDYLHRFLAHPIRRNHGTGRYSELLMYWLKPKAGSEK